MALLKRTRKMVRSDVELPDENEVQRILSGARARWSHYMLRYMRQNRGGGLTPRQGRRLRKKDRIIMKRGRVGA